MVIVASPSLAIAACGVIIGMAMLVDTREAIDVAMDCSMKLRRDELVGME